MLKTPRISSDAFTKLLSSSRADSIEFCLQPLYFDHLRNTLLKRNVPIFDPTKRCFCINILSKASGTYQKHFPSYWVPELIAKQVQSL